MRKLKGIYSPSDDFKPGCAGLPASNHLEAYLQGEGPLYKNHLICRFGAY
jgi:hypothetical protein